MKKMERYEKIPAFWRNILMLCAVLVGGGAGWAAMSQSVVRLEKDMDKTVQAQAGMQEKIHVLETGLAVISTKLESLGEAQRDANEDRKMQFRAILRELRD